MDELVQALIQYATDHYNEGGWDVLIECYEPEGIESILREDGATTLEQAIASFQPLIGFWAERQADADNSAF